MRHRKFVFVMLSAVALRAQTAAPAGNETWKALSFLEGTWDAKTEGGPVASIGNYTFRKELGGHVIARHSLTANCKAPADFDCEHRDLLYIYQDAPGQQPKAIYFDSEGHVIHYDVATPTARSVRFLSDASTPGPQFQLLYELKNATMSGKFQMRPPGQTEWKSYLEWSGTKK